MILVRSVHLKLVSTIFFNSWTYYIWICHPSFPPYMPSLQASLHISRAITDSPSHQLAKSWSLPRRPRRMNWKEKWKFHHWAYTRQYRQIGELNTAHSAENLLPSFLFSFSICSQALIVGDSRLSNKVSINPIPIRRSKFFIQIPPMDWWKI